MVGGVDVPWRIYAGSCRGNFEGEEVDGAFVGASSEGDGGWGYGLLRSLDYHGNAASASFFAVEFSYGSGILLHYGNALSSISSAG